MDSLYPGMGSQVSSATKHSVPARQDFRLPGAKNRGVPTDLRAAKAELRADILARRAALTAEETAARSAAIAEAVRRLPLFRTAGTFAAYMPIGQEVDPRGLIADALARGARVCLPRTHLRERLLTLHAVTSLDGLVAGPYDIPEPPADAPEVRPEDVEFFLVPGSVYDAAGNRIGYGAGYYDSLLVRSEGWRVAPAYACQLVHHVPSAEHDMPMDAIVTELGLIDCAQGQRATDHLRLRNMTFYGYHGAFPQEREQGIRLAIDVDLRLDLQVAGLTDDLSTTVNYPRVYRLIDRIQQGREFSLFEALIAAVVDAILREFPAVVEATITARKYNPPVGGLMDAFEVEISRTRWVG